MKTRTRVWLLVALLFCTGALFFVGRPITHIARAAYRDRRRVQPVRSGFVDDASRLNATRVKAIVDVSADDRTAIAQIRSAFADARRAGVGVSIAGVRHSMGGQTIARNGIVLNMLNHNRIEVRGEQLHVQSGAIWKDILVRLDRAGRSVEVMQSDSAFSVGGSLSVNCHGWQHMHQPIASTVMAMTVVLPDGEVVHCSPSERPDLFAHVLGGYGLFGVILDADLRTVPNERYRIEHRLCDAASYESTFDRIARDPGVAMSYGRISVAPERFLREAVLTTFRREPGPIPSMSAAVPASLARAVFRGSVKSDYGKSLRWQLEREVMPRVERISVSRNDVLNGDIEIYIDHSPESTDILHEYFVPRGKVSAFLDSIRPVLRRERADLLNVTVRDVRKDEITALPFAREDVFALVMFFHQERSAAADADMQRLTRELIDLALAQNGTYYLPYRLHATDEQFHRAYPAANDFAQKKKAVDPKGLLTNAWYERYFGR